MSNMNRYWTASKRVLRGIWQKEVATEAGDFWSASHAHAYWA